MSTLLTSQQLDIEQPAVLELGQKSDLEKTPVVDIETSRQGESATFRWNSRQCTGNHLHHAVLDADVGEVARILSETPDLVSSRFTYETCFKGTKQEGSGVALHLAASRGYTDVAALLLEYGASTDACVTRGGNEHYGVLHAAVFGEGRGGDANMVRLLLDANAEITRNLDGRWPLHVAYTTGQEDMILLFQEEMQNRGLSEFDETDVSIITVGSRPVPSPLQLGIQERKLTGEQLGKLAPCKLESALVFIRYDPRCLLSFLERKDINTTDFAQALGSVLGMKDLCELMWEYPEAALAILNVLVHRPHCEGEGWHPLPVEMSFAPRNFREKLRDLLNPPRTCHPMYVPDNDWKYDVVRFDYPAWHKVITQRKGNPIRDVSIKVCLLPNTIDSSFLNALSNTDIEKGSLVFENTAVLCMLDIVWWQGAVKVDLVQVLISLWCLFLLVLQTIFTVDKHGHSHRFVWDFVTARAILDLVHEVLQVIGLAKINKVSSYFTCDNFLDLSRSALPLVLLFLPDETERVKVVVHVAVVLSYWMRLLEVNFSESMSRELLPIMHLVRGLIPCSIVALIGFCSLAHAFHILGDNPDVFDMLVLGANPAPRMHDSVHKMLAYISILAFTVFFLNIFIGVIGENYSKQKDLAGVVFQQTRSRICSTYMLRASVVPCRLCRPSVATLASLLAAGVCIVFQYEVYRGAKMPFDLTIIFVLCQMVMLLSAYQTPDAPWVQREAEPHYLWYVETMRIEMPSELDRLQSQLEDRMQAQFEKLTNIVIRHAQTDLGSPVAGNAVPGAMGLRRRSSSSVGPMRRRSTDSMIRIAM
mmetsp:Transcript_143608/g.357925  ORF Transcript_143608/g.357925 Transcript_143608/m.357925 type:complete len:817 (-) Transcript_143608:132-2582(-)